LSKPATPKIFFATICIVAVMLVAAAALIAVAPAKSSGRLGRAAVSTAASNSHAVMPADHARINAAYAALPLAFEANQGQVDPQVKYMARGNGYRLYLASSEVVFTLHKRGEDSEVRQMMMNRRIGLSKIKNTLRHRQQTLQASAAAVHMYMLGSNPDAQLAAQDPQEGKVNYFVGKDPSRWHSGVPLFGQVSYRRLYPGVDLAFHGSGKQLEFDYLVSPGADTKSIALGFRGADRVTTNAAGSLVLNTAAGTVALNRPVAYQEQNGKREIVDARYVVHAGYVRFALGPYDHSRQLVIDPTMTYSTYFGGDFADYGLAIAVDASGNEYVAGATDSDAIPGWNSATDSSSFDIFVTKISSAGTLLNTTEFGGSGDEFPGGIAVDATGIYVSGTTDSSDFPVTPGAAQTVFVGGGTDGNNDAFAAKLTLGGLLGPTVSGTWASYINGSDSTSGLAVAIDGSENMYVVGETFAPDLGGVTGGVHPLPNGGAINLGLGTGDDDGYLVKLNSTGTAFDLVSYIGGSGPDLATGVTLDGSGNIYVSGETVSTDLPVINALQSKCGTDSNCNTGQDDAFIAAIKVDLSGYTYLTYYGGSGIDDAFAITADSGGDVFITGQTQSSDFPTVGTAFQASLAGAQNAFLVELNSTGAATYGTYLGGNGTDLGLGIAQDGLGNAYITGQTSSTQTSPGAFPLVNPTQPAFGGSTDAFVTVLSTSQNSTLFSTYLGGGGDEDQLGGAVALDSSHNIYVTGDTDSGNGSTAVFPTKNALDGTYGAGTCLSSSNTNVPCTDAFVAAYGPATAPDFAIAATAPAAVSPGSSGTSTVSLTSLNGYNSSVSLSCSVSGSGSPAPACSASSFNPGTVTPANPAATSTLTITTTGSSAAMFRPSKFLYAMWLPIAGFSLMGMGFSSARSRRKKLLGFLMIGMVMTALFLMPACGGSSNNGGGGGGGGGCTGCTPAGTYTVTITGTGTDASTTTHSTTVMLTVN
jgi:hypothetical protein